VPFKPGQSGNPATQFKPGVQPPGGGKPKGAKHLSTWIQELLNDEQFETVIIDAKKGVVEYKGAPLKAILAAQIQMALHSKDESIRLKAFDMLGKYGYGTKLELANNPENPITSPVTRDELDAFLTTIKDATKQK
jgi:hypothetical protein